MCLPCNLLHVHSTVPLHLITYFMQYLSTTVQIILFLVFAVGGTIRFVQPIDTLARRMLWVRYFSPRIVRGIALIEVFCGIGIILPLVFTGSSFSFLLFSGCLLMATMIGAVITHIVIGDYKQIIGNFLILGMIYWITFSVGI